MSRTCWGHNYECCHLDANRAGHGIIRLQGRHLDAFVVDRVLAALAPPQVEAACSLLGEVHAQQAQARAQLERQVHRAEELASRAADRLKLALDYRLDARIVTDYQAEQMQARQQVETLRDRLRREWSSPMFGPDDAAKLMALATRIRGLWEAPTTSNEDRQRLIQAAISQITVHRATNTLIEIEIVWGGGASERHVLPRPVTLGQRIAELAGAGSSPDAIVVALTGDHETTSRGTAVTRDRVCNVLRGLGLPRLKCWREALPLVRELRSQGLTMSAIAAELNRRGLRHWLGDWTEARVQGAVRRLRRADPPDGRASLPKPSPLTRTATNLLAAGIQGADLLDRVIDAARDRPNPERAAWNALRALRRSGRIRGVKYRAVQDAWRRRRPRHRGATTAPEVFEMMRAGVAAGHSWATIAEQLNARGLKPASAQCFSAGILWGLFGSNRERFRGVGRVAPDGRVTRKSVTAAAAFIEFFKARGRASRGEYLAHFAGRYSARVLDPLRKRLVRKGTLSVIQGRRGLPAVWQWRERARRRPRRGPTP